ncbi:MAG: alpha,alpha-trehalase TreF [Roseivirga sp.]|uniref:alpha,alpha-trehalase TreF n=1 Tax=Roseivirga sp. TaxID=1964215 RepID=UPI001B28CBF8|nr:alpha,alpha-trehalase TreF [Roseivirga sp.]MBO6659110.1 alpha,alpha-trehalase TreF [Roseivirga sp.]MBO6908153.1 alpha,alpha-trehalase TreF [Roseivirga sp.]
MNKLIFSEKDFQELFTDLHASGLWLDGKELSDAVTIESPEEILTTYRKQKSNKNFDLKKFFETYFYPAPTREVNYQSDTSKPVEDHIEKLWPILSRQPEEQEFFSTLIPLPHPYVVPGGRFNEIYYWDSYFTMLGLVESRRIQLVEDMVKNFSYMIENFGFIPNGNRTYYLGRSQPPFFSLMVALLAEQKGDDSIVEFLPSMVHEYEFWMEGSESLSKEKPHHKRAVLLSSGEILNRYYDNMHSPRAEMYQDDVDLIREKGSDGEQTLLNIRAACESGWDFSSRWFEVPNELGTIRTTDLVQVDLNSLLYHLEQMIAKGYRIKGEEKEANMYLSLAENRAKAIQKYFWNEGSGFYFDFNHQLGAQASSITAAATFPLALGIASKAQAERTALVLENELLMEGGLLTTNYQSGQQWDAPNGWAPLQWMAIWGLRNYGINGLANQIKDRWVSLNIKVFKNTGKLMEKYNVVDTSLLSGGGEYPVQDGFGWTNGVLLKLLNS